MLGETCLMYVIIERNFKVIFQFHNWSFGFRNYYSEFTNSSSKLLYVNSTKFIAQYFNHSFFFLLLTVQ